MDCRERNGREFGLNFSQGLSLAWFTHGALSSCAYVRFSPAQPRSTSLRTKRRTRHPWFRIGAAIRTVWRSALGVKRTAIRFSSQVRFPLGLICQTLTPMRRYHKMMVHGGSVPSSAISSQRPEAGSLRTSQRFLPPRDRAAPSAEKAIVRPPKARAIGALTRTALRNGAW